MLFRGAIVVLVLGLVSASDADAEPEYDAAKEYEDIFMNDLAKICHPVNRSMDLLFILDGSGSTGGNTFGLQKDMVNRIVDTVDIKRDKTRVAVLQYAGYTRMEFQFNDYFNKTDLKEAISKIRHISGTTRTGKALRRAQSMFHREMGARPENGDFARVTIVVGDGYSADNPFEAARGLRAKGVTLLAVGIGNFINMKELIEMVGDERLAFENYTIGAFEDTFKKLAIGEKCLFAKGDDGAEVICQSNHIRVNVQTKRDFKGHLYVPRFYKRAGCSARASYWNASLVSLNIPLDYCGVQRQFLFNPRGLLFETEVLLKYHPFYHTKLDKTFSVKCFYPDMRFPVEKTMMKKSDSQQSIGSDSDYELTTEPTEDLYQSSSYNVPEMVMPCTYSVRKENKDGCIVEDAKVGDTVVHKWECDSKVLGNNYRMLIYNCSMEDPFRRSTMQVIDSYGCSLDPNVILEPKYESPWLITATGTVVKYADNPMLKFTCKIKFCNQVNGECNYYLPLQCAAPARRKRQISALAPFPKQMTSRLSPFPYQSRMMEQLFFGRNNAGINVAAGISNVPRVATFGSPRVPRPPAPPPVILPPAGMPPGLKPAAAVTTTTEPTTTTTTVKTTTTTEAPTTTYEYTEETTTYENTEETTTYENTETTTYENTEETTTQTQLESTEPVTTQTTQKQKEEILVFTPKPYNPTRSSGQEKPTDPWENPKQERNDPANPWENQGVSTFVIGSNSKLPVLESNEEEKVPEVIQFLPKAVNVAQTQTAQPKPVLKASLEEWVDYLQNEEDYSTETDSQTLTDWQTKTNSGAKTETQTSIDDQTQNVESSNPQADTQNKSQTKKLKMEEKPMKEVEEFDLQGLTETIIRKLDLATVEVDSQTMMVHNKVERGSQESPVDWCPRSNV